MVGNLKVDGKKKVDRGIANNNTNEPKSNVFLLVLGINLGLFLTYYLFVIIKLFSGNFNSLGGSNIAIALYGSLVHGILSILIGLIVVAFKKNKVSSAFILSGTIILIIGSGTCFSGFFGGGF